MSILTAFWVSQVDILNDLDGTLRSAVLREVCVNLTTKILEQTVGRYMMGLCLQTDRGQVSGRTSDFPGQSSSCGPTDERMPMIWVHYLERIGMKMNFKMQWWILKHPNGVCWSARLSFEWRMNSNCCRKFTMDMYYRGLMTNVLDISFPACEGTVFLRFDFQFYLCPKDFFSRCVYSWQPLLFLDANTAWIQSPWITSNRIINITIFFLHIPAL